MTGMNKTFKTIVWLIAVLAFCLLPVVVAFAQPLHESPGWSFRTGFDTSAIEGPGDMRETAWSAWIATQAGLDPVEVCEVQTLCGSRVDILTSSEAIEVEWAYKWKESIAQSLLYAMETGHDPAVILLSDGTDQVHILRCLAVCERAGIRLYVQRIPKWNGDSLDGLPPVPPGPARQTSSIRRTSKSARFRVVSAFT